MFGMRSLRIWLQGIGLLRYPELVRWLGEQRFHLQRVQRARRAAPLAKIADSVQLIGYEEDRLELGEQSTVEHGSLLAFGDDENGFGRICVGAHCWIGQYNNLRASGGADIRIGDHCLISQFCTLVASNHALRRGQHIREQGPDRSRRGVVLGEDVWLGAGVTVAPGVIIGSGAVVGANSVVTRPVPDFEIWAGCPARKIGARQ